MAFYSAACARRRAQAALTDARNFPELRFRTNSRRLTTTRNSLYFGAMQLFGALPGATRSLKPLPLLLRSSLVTPLFNQRSSRCNSLLNLRKTSDWLEG